MDVGIHPNGPIKQKLILTSGVVVAEINTSVIMAYHMMFIRKVL